MEFAATYCDFNFALGEGVNEPQKCIDVPRRMLAARGKTGRDVGNYMLFMVIADETDEAALAKWDLYNAGADRGRWRICWAMPRPTQRRRPPWPRDQALAPAHQLQHGHLVGSYATVARMLDEAASMPGTKGLMLIFDDFITGMDTIGQRIQPLMECRKHVMAAAA